MQAIVNISLKDGVLDPQGRAISHSLNDLGFNEVSDVRVGKQIRLEIDENELPDSIKSDFTIQSHQKNNDILDTHATPRYKWIPKQHNKSLNTDEKLVKATKLTKIPKLEITNVDLL